MIGQMIGQVPPQLPNRRPPKIAFIGEAPSHEEILKGKPFTGPSGRVFNSLLRGAGLDRDEFLVTNVFSEKLPDNEVGAWCARLDEARVGKFTDIPPIGDAGFLRPEYRWHLERLKKELEEWQPTVIVPLGGTALWAMTGQTGIGAVRGTIAEAKLIVPSAKLIPTYHPAFVMKSWKYYTVVVGDFQKAAKEAERGRAIIQPRRELVLEPSLADIADAIPRLLNTDLLSVDIETAWSQITCVGFAPSPEYALCIPFFDKRNSDKSYWRSVADEARAWGYIRELCASDAPKLGQNFSGYDLYWLLRRYRIRVNNITHDTRLQHHALFAELPKSLEFMQSYATQGSWKHMGKHKEKRDD